jgi:hypothetical protein
MGAQAKFLTPKWFHNSTAVPRLLEGLRHSQALPQRHEIPARQRPDWLFEIGQLAVERWHGGDHCARPIKLGQTSFLSHESWAGERSPIGSPFRILNQQP